MSTKKTVPKKEKTDKELRIEAIDDLKSKIIKECKNLATFKTSSARNINELTKQLLTMEKSA